MLKEAVAHHQAGRLKEAEETYRAVLAGNPDDVDALHLLGALLMQIGSMLEGETLLRRAVKLAPDHAPALENLGHGLRMLGQMHEAAETLESCLHEDPDRTGARLGLAGALAALNRFAPASDAYQSALLADPSSCEALRGLLLLNHAHGQIDEALLYLQRLRALEGNSPGLAALMRTMLAEGSGRAALPDTPHQDMVAQWRDLLEQNLLHENPEASIIEFGWGELSLLALQGGARHALVVTPSQSAAAVAREALAASFTPERFTISWRAKFNRDQNKPVDLILFSGAGRELALDQNLTGAGIRLRHLLNDHGTILPATITAKATLTGDAGPAARIRPADGFTLYATTTPAQLWLGPEASAALVPATESVELGALASLHGTGEGLGTEGANLCTEFQGKPGARVEGAYLQVSTYPRLNGKERFDDAGGILLPFPVARFLDGKGMIEIEFGRDFGQLWADEVTRPKDRA